MAQKLDLDKVQHTTSVNYDDVVDVLTWTIDSRGRITRTLPEYAGQEVKILVLKPKGKVDIPADLAVWMREQIEEINGKLNGRN